MHQLNGARKQIPNNYLSPLGRSERITARALSYKNTLQYAFSLV